MGVLFSFRFVKVVFFYYSSSSFLKGEGAGWAVPRIWLVTVASARVVDSKIVEPIMTG